MAHSILVIRIMICKGLVMRKLLFRFVLSLLLTGGLGSQWPQFFFFGFNQAAASLAVGGFNFFLAGLAASDFIFFGWVYMGRLAPRSLCRP